MNTNQNHMGTKQTRPVYSASSHLFAVMIPSHDTRCYAKSIQQCLHVLSLGKSCFQNLVSGSKNLCTHT